MSQDLGVTSVPSIGRGLTLALAMLWVEVNNSDHYLHSTYYAMEIVVTMH